MRLFKIHLENKRPLLKGDIAAGESQEVQFPKQKVIALQGIKIFKQIPPWESRKIIFKNSLGGDMWSFQEGKIPPSPCA